MKKTLVALLKVSVSVAMLVWLGLEAHRNAVFSDLVRRPKNWGLLASAAGVCFLAVLITFVRWYWLVRALALPFRLREAMRLGFLGYLFNLLPMGIVGGDLLKAVVLARRHPGHRAEAVATIVVDRVIGLYVLFLVAAAAALLTGLWQSPDENVRWICRVTWILAGAGTVAVVVLLFPDVTGGTVGRWLARIPYTGRILQRLLEAVRLYRQSYGVLLASALMTVPVHCLFALGVYLIAAGLYDPVLPLEVHLVVVPLSAATAVLPVNVGPFEFVLDQLYVAIPLADGGSMVGGQGLVVALGYRLITVLIAGVGMIYYFGGRREVAEAMHAAEEDEYAPATHPPSSLVEAP